MANKFYVVGDRVKIEEGFDNSDERYIGQTGVVETTANFVRCVSVRLDSGELYTAGPCELVLISDEGIELGRDEVTDLELKPKKRG